jgi:hypothetical protein
MLAQFTNQTRIPFVKHFSRKETAPTHAALNGLLSPSVLHILTFKRAGAVLTKTLMPLCFGSDDK